MTMERVFVVGAGYMGNGIAQVSALAGYAVKMCDVSEGCLESGIGEIERSLGKFLSKDKISREQYDSTLANLTTTCELDEAADADMVVEAVPEKQALKEEIFSRLDAICPEHTILGTNTSAIPISSIAAATGRPDRVVGIHFFGPVPLMRLVEVIKGLLTSDGTMTAADEWARSLGKETVLVLKDHAGFVANRVNIPASVEAVRMVASECRLHRNHVLPDRVAWYYLDHLITEQRREAVAKSAPESQAHLVSGTIEAKTEGENVAKTSDSEGTAPPK